MTGPYFRRFRRACWSLRCGDSARHTAGRFRYAAIERYENIAYCARNIWVKKNDLIHRYGHLIFTGSHHAPAALRR